MAKAKSVIDRVGPWTDIKHEVLNRYCEQYALILQRASYLSPEYIEGFAGAGLVERRSSDMLDAGSALNALNLEPAFDRYHFVELDTRKEQHLREMISGHPLAGRVSTYQGDCNEVLLNSVFPRFVRSHKRRGFCLLDPYGLHLDWQVIQAAGELGTLEVMINFPAMDIEMNAFKRDHGRIHPQQAHRFSRFWGDDSWEQVAYTKSENLFGETVHTKTHMSALVRAFCDRLRHKARFAFVATPGKFKNSREGVLYYMVFATQNRVGHKIGDYVLKTFV